jgi:hypothetical protein
MARLQALAFEPDAGAANTALDQRRTLDQGADPACGVDNVVARKQRGIS